MAKVGETVSCRDGVDIKAAAVVFDVEMKALRLPTDLDGHDRGFGMACDVVGGFAEEEEDLPMKLKRGSCRIICAGRTE